MGNTVTEAAEKLNESNLNYTVEGSPEVLALPANQQVVILTNPVSGTTVARKSTVKLYVGTREDYQNGGTPTPTPPQAVIEVKVANGTYGTVTGGGQYELNTQVTLTATPATGYVFECWLDAYGNTIAYSNTYTFAVKESTSFTAVFSPLPTATPVPATNTPTPTPVPPPTDTPVPPPPGPEDPGQGGGGPGPAVG